MHPFRPPFAVPSRPMNPNTTQLQQPFNFQDMDHNMLSYAAYLSGATPFVQPTFGFGQVGGSQPSQQQSEPDVDIVPETQPEPERETSKRDRRSHKKETNEPRRKHSYLNWTKEEEYTLARAWLEVSEDPEIGNFYIFFFTYFFVHVYFVLFLTYDFIFQFVANFQTDPEFWNRIRALFYSTWGKCEHRDKDSIYSKWTDINNKCHSFQEVYQRNYDNRPSGEGDVGVLTKALEEYERTKCPFPYYKCWDLLSKSPKWAGVVTMTPSSRRRAKRSKTSSSDARNVDLNEVVDVDEQLEEELARPPGRRKDKRTGKKTVESSSDLELKEDFEEMNRRLQDIRDLGHQCLETMKERVAETKKFNEMQEARQMEKDIEFLSKPIDHLQGDALILAHMHRQKIREKYDSRSSSFFF
ncbi:putative glutathione transferase [Helianthus debilis subsp. tardiflorus]